MYLTLQQPSALKWLYLKYSTNIKFLQWYLKINLIANVFVHAAIP